MQTLYKDNYSFGLPKMNFLVEPYDEIVTKMNQLMSNNDSPLKVICQKCAMYTLPIYEYKSEGKWKVAYSRGEESWGRETHLEYDLDLKNILNTLVSEWIEQKRTVLIYGAGVHTQDLFNYTDLSKAKIIALVDSDPKKQDLRFRSYEVISPEKIIDLRPDIVLISSKAFEDVIYNQLIYLEKFGIKIIRIYK